MRLSGHNESKNYSIVQTNVTASHMRDREYQVSVFCDINFIRQGFENACSITRLSRNSICTSLVIQYEFAKQSLVNLISKDANQVFYFFSLQVGSFFKLAIVT